MCNWKVEHFLGNIVFHLKSIKSSELMKTLFTSSCFNGYFQYVNIR
jgi:hypothetical protein